MPTDANPRVRLLGAKVRLVRYDRVKAPKKIPSVSDVIEVVAAQRVHVHTNNACFDHPINHVPLGLKPNEARYRSWLCAEDVPRLSLFCVATILKRKASQACPAL